jgi:hypothetical protein
LRINSYHPQTECSNLNRCLCQVSGFRILTKQACFVRISKILTSRNGTHVMTRDVTLLFSVVTNVTGNRRPQRTMSRSRWPRGTAAGPVARPLQVVGQDRMPNALLSVMKTSLNKAGRSSSSQGPGFLDSSAGGVISSLANTCAMICPTRRCGWCGQAKFTGNSMHEKPATRQVHAAAPKVFGVWRTSNLTCGTECLL